jgi:hypothetical protein
MTLQKPIIVKHITGKSPFGNNGPDAFKQTLLLQALRHTTDPKKLRVAAGLKSVAEVHRVLDKLSMRKEYNKALELNGIDFNFIAQGLKKEAVSSGNKGSERIKALEVLLKSQGMSDYKDDDGTSHGSWEDVLLEQIEREKAQAAIPEPRSAMMSLPERADNEPMEVYEVNEPPMPQSVKDSQKKEIGLIGGVTAGHKIYG